MAEPTRLIKLGGMYKNVSKRTGATYFSGFFGSAKLLLFENKEQEEGKPNWTIFIAEQPPKKEQTR